MTPLEVAITVIACWALLGLFVGGRVVGHRTRPFRADTVDANCFRKDAVSLGEDR